MRTIYNGKRLTVGIDDRTIAFDWENGYKEFGF